MLNVCKRNERKGVIQYGVQPNNSPGTSTGTAVCRISGNTITFNRIDDDISDCPIMQLSLPIKPNSTK